MLKLNVDDLIKVISNGAGQSGNLTIEQKPCGQINLILVYEQTYVKDLKIVLQESKNINIIYQLQNLLKNTTQVGKKGYSMKIPQI